MRALTSTPLPPTLYEQGGITIIGIKICCCVAIMNSRQRRRNAIIRHNRAVVRLAVHQEVQKLQQQLQPLTTGAPETSSSVCVDVGTQPYVPPTSTSVTTTSVRVVVPPVITTPPGTCLSLPSPHRNRHRRISPH